MKIFLCCCCMVLSLHALPQTNTFPKRGSMVVDLYTDYSNEDFRWSIAGNSSGQNPNILSEVIWRNLQGFGVGGEIRIPVWSHFILLADYHKTFLRAGRVTDTDYAGDDRTDITYHAALNANEGYTDHYAASLGYTFLITSRLFITPLAGYTKNRQSLHLKGFEDQEDEYSQLNSTYQSKWDGLLVGVINHFTFNRKVYLEARLDYKQLKYKAIADWNLIDIFDHPISFKHSGNGFEAGLQMKFGIKVSARVSGFIIGNYFRAETGRGTDQLFLATGQEQFSQFNGAVREGVTAGMGINLRFP